MTSPRLADWQLSKIEKRRELSPIEQIVAPPILRRLTASECSLDLDYLNWSYVYHSMRFPEMALKLAFKAAANSPLSPKVWVAVIICLVETVVPRSWLQAAKWYLHRASKWLRMGRISS